MYDAYMYDLNLEDYGSRGLNLNKTSWYYEIGITFKPRDGVQTLEHLNPCLMLSV